ncbi:MAG: cytochrome c oxidase subunit 3 [Acidobacteriota bacterium]
MPDAMIPRTVIPYTVEPRPDTGLSNVKIGVWLFLASEVMLFGGLFAGYIILRVGSTDWLPGSAFGLSVPLAFANTLVLTISSITMVAAWISLLRKRFSQYRRYMGSTLLCGLIFLVLTGFEFAGRLRQDQYPSTHIFLALYFTLTALHGLHLIAGMGYNAYLWGPGSRMWETAPEQFTQRVEASGLFWHLVALVWILLFPMLYLL